MDDLKEQELYAFPRQNGMSRSYLLPSVMASETSEKIWQMSHLPESSTAFSKSFVASTDDIKPALDLLKENNMQFSPISRKYGGNLKDTDMSNSKLKARPRPMLDLQLPADVYIDVEDSDRLEQEPIANSYCRSRDSLSMISDMEHENDVKLTLGTREDCSIGSSSLHSIQQSGHAVQRVDNLNDLKRGLCYDGQSGSVSNHVLHLRSNHEVQGQQLPTEPNRMFLPMDISTDKHTNKESCSNFFDANNGKSKQEWQSFDSEDAGRSRNTVNSIPIDLASREWPLTYDPLELEVKREFNDLYYDHGEMHTWFEKKPTLGVGTYQQDSSCIDLNNSALTNYKVPDPLSVVPYAENLSCALPVVSSRRRIPRVINYIPIAVQALPCFPASEMVKSRGRKPKVRNSTLPHNKLQVDGDLNSHSSVGVELPSSQNDFHPDLWSDSYTFTQFRNNSDSSIHENSEDYAFQKFPKLQNDVSLNPFVPKSSREDGKPEELPERGSWLQAKPFGTASQGNSSLPKGFYLPPDYCTSSLQVKAKRKRRNEEAAHNVSAADQLQRNHFRSFSKHEVSEVGTVTEKCTTTKNIFDLNTTEDEVPSVSKKIADDVDLYVEDPISSFETLESLAAEDLVIMSLDLSQQSAPDLLHWFAEVVSSEEAKAEYENDNGEDSFESMTLKLNEMKPDEYLPLQQELDNWNNDENDRGSVSLFLTKTGRGQARKRRKMKDFRKEVLPGLMSLSRHQVMEDLQAFDYLMRAMGEDWQSNLTRRRGRPRGPTTVAIRENCSQLAPKSNGDENEIGERSILGWGRRTRRGRRPRVRPASASLLVS